MKTYSFKIISYCSLNFAYKRFPRKLLVCSYKIRDLNNNIICNRRSFTKTSYFQHKEEVQMFDIFNTKLAENKPKNPDQPQVQLVALNSGAEKGSKSFYLSTLASSYFFNFGDGSLRNAQEFAAKISGKDKKLDGVFCTSKKWENIAGLVNLHSNLHNLAGKKKKDKCYFTVYGHEGYKEAILNLEKMVTHIPFPSTGSDRNLCAFNFTEIPTSNPQLIKTKCMSVQPVIISGNQKGLDNAVAYICTLNSNLKRKLTICKLLEKDVPPGPLVVALREGKSVTLPNGTIVHADDVSSYLGDVGKSFLILDVPTQDHIEDLITKREFHPYFKDSSEQMNFEAIIHLSSSEVLMDPRFTDWVNHFPSSVHHMIINEKSHCLSIPKFEKYHKNLSFFPNIFLSPFAYHNRKAQLPPNYNFNGIWKQAQSNLKFVLRPKNYFDDSRCPSVEYLSSCSMEYDEVVYDMYEKLVKKFPSMESILNKKDKPFPHLYFLGTGSSQGGCYRNASSILMQTGKDQYTLIDCGAGTMDQILRLFGLKKTEDILRGLQFIFVSHRHKDHLLGINTILEERKKTFLKHQCSKIPKLYVAGELKLKSYMSILHTEFTPIFDHVTFINNEEFTLNRARKPNTTTVPSVHQNLGMKQIVTTKVDHCSNAYGIAFTHRDGWKIVFSGDTRPTKTLVDIGVGCDLLIHEATFEDGMEILASTKLHSTTSQAIEISRQMKAKYVILNHFSLRYEGIPFIKGQLPSNVGISFDFMKVTLDDLPFLSGIFHIVREIFFEQNESFEVKHERKEKLNKKDQSESIEHEKTICYFKQKVK